jgi:hypothetical protein
MAKSADGPISGRTGFGWDQARKVGAPFLAPRSGHQYDSDLKKTRAVRELLREIDADDGWRPFVQHWAKEGVDPRDVLNDLARAKRYM